LDCENEFSAKVSSGGVVSDENVDWINSIAITDTSLFTISFKTGAFTSAPNCNVTVVDGVTSYDAMVKVSTQATTSQVQVRGGTSSSAVNFNKSAQPFNIHCSRGTDSKSLREQGALLSPGSAGARLGVYSASRSNISLSSTATTVTFADELFSKYITWDNSAHEATVQKSGTYDIFVTMTFYDIDSGSVYSYFVEVDSGSGFSQPASTQTGSGYTRNDTNRISTVANKFLVDLKAGDKFRIRATSTVSSLILYTSNRGPTMTVTPVPTIDQMAAEIQGASADRYCFVRDVKSSGTNGGTASTTPVKRDLNQTKGACDYLTLADSTMTLQPGTYKISWSASAVKTNRSQSALKDATAGAYVQMGSTEYSPASGGDSVWSRGTHVVTITAANNYEIFHEVQTSGANTGWGIAAGGQLSITTEEIYTQVEVEKLK